MKPIDVHAHLVDDAFKEDLKNVIERVEENLSACICAGCDILSSKQTVELANENQKIFAAVGVHPQNVDGLDVEKALTIIEDLAKNKKVVAIGEIGLDYHFVQDNKDLQKQFFSGQLNLANRLNLPVVIHSRDAIGDTIDILKTCPLKRESLIHCYSGSLESAKILISYGYSFSFGGVVTFSNAKNVVEVVKNLPMDKILLETDCPYMTPVPFRGQRNEPKNVVYVADTIARIKGVSFEEIVEKTTENARKMFNL